MRACWILAASAVLMATPGQAQRRCPAHRHAEALENEGVRLRGQDPPDDAGALALFEQAYALCPRPRTLIRMAGAEGALGRWLEASEHAHRGDERADPWVMQHRDAIDHDLALYASHVGAPAVAGRVEMPTRAPTPVPTPTTEEPRETVVQPSTPAAHDTVTVTTPVTERPAPTRERGGTMKALAWASAAGALAGLTTGIVATIVRLNAASTYDGPQCTPVEVSPDCGSTYTTAWSTMPALQIAGYASAGVLGVASTVLFLLSRPREARAPSVSWACGAGPGVVGVRCGMVLP